MGRRKLGHLLVGATALSALALPLSGVAGAQTNLDPADPCPPGVNAAPSAFVDRESIPPVHRMNVDCLAALGVVQGRSTNPPRFEPAGTVGRDQMASWLIRALERSGITVPPADGAPFRDIAGNVHEEAINRLATIDVTEGRTADTYDPSAPVRRDQMSSFLIRAANFAYGGDDLAAGTEGGNPFTDVAADSVHTPAILAAEELLGVTTGQTPDRYNPGAPTTRDQMATFVTRLVDMTHNVEA